MGQIPNRTFKIDTLSFFTGQMPYPPLSQKHQRTGEITLLYLKYNGLVISLQVEGKYVGVHKSLATLTQNVDGFLEKLNFNPRHVVLLH